MGRRSYSNWEDKDRCQELQQAPALKRDVSIAYPLRDCGREGLISGSGTLAHETMPIMGITMALMYPGPCNGASCN